MAARLLIYGHNDTCPPYCGLEFNCRRCFNNKQGCLYLLRARYDRTPHPLTPPPVIFSQRAREGWRACRGPSHAHTIQPLCVLETHRQLNIKSRFCRGGGREKDGEKEERGKKKTVLLKVLPCLLAAASRWIFHNWASMEPPVGEEEEEGEIDHQGRNNLEISAKALFFSC